MKRPQIKILLTAISTLLSDYDRTAIIYLDIQGRWCRNPRSLRDRVSSELWYRFYELHKQNALHEQATTLFAPLLQNTKTWLITQNIAKNVSKVCDANHTGALICTEAICQFIKFAVFQRLSTDYVAQWDSSGKLRKSKNTKNAEQFIHEVKDSICNKSDITYLYTIIDRVTCENQSLFKKVSDTLYEEEKIRYYLGRLSNGLHHSSNHETLYNVLGHISGAELGVISKNQGAYLRPCVELLGLSDVPVSSGLQFEISGLLGRLQDPRTLRALIEALDKCDTNHVNVRCNLIYAIGNLCEKSVLKHFIEILNSKK